MKLSLASLSLGLSLATAFVIPQHGVKSSTVVLHSKVNSMWAFDVYGREDGQLPSQEIMYVEGDPWYFNPRSGLGQSDFYPRSHAGNRLQTTVAAGAVPPSPQAAVPPPQAVAPQAPGLPAGEAAEPVPEMEMPKLEETQAKV